MIYPVFATPSLTASVCMEFFHSYLGSSELLRAAGITHTFIRTTGDCYLAHARNRLVHIFLTRFPDATHLFFLDDDLGWPAEAIPRLLQDPVDVVAGIYPKKQARIDFPGALAQTAFGASEMRGGLVRALAVPTGFLCIRRSVIERMAESTQVYKHRADDGSFDMVHEVFRMGTYGSDEWWGEDIDWCNRWIAMGGDIWVDPDIEFTHRGQSVWRGRLMDHGRVHQGEVKGDQNE